MEFTDANFTDEVIKSKVPVLVDFWAPWCGPCRMQGPIIENLKKEYAGKPVKIGKMNVDENDRTPQKFGVMSIPTLIIFKNGKIVEQMVGVQSKEVLKRKLEAVPKS
ncbi:MAG: thioredoxin [Candidatus Magasanikbacteria bacterium]|nr:thioredoxin [Candidatus Magasanikbacteria bacterium]